uniref:Large ribosomal subunit protein mL43 n=1 Tax=Panagrellus redivivus TaxID=6233 RepID=A0A7E4W1I3_PANRE
MPARPRVDRLKTVYTAAKQLNFGFRLTGFPSAPNENGIASYKPQLHRLTIRFCKQNEASSGLRNFIDTALKAFAAANPQTVVYVLPIRNATPTLRAEYSNGREVQINAKGFTLERAAIEINLLRTRSGEPIVKFESPQTAQVPSIQGQWNTLTWANPAQNAVELPAPEFNVYRTPKLSATEYIQNLVYKNPSEAEEQSQEAEKPKRAVA